MHASERGDLIERLDRLVLPHRAPLARQIRRMPFAAAQRMLIVRVSLLMMRLGWNVGLRRRSFTGEAVVFPFPACWDLLIYRTYIDEAELRLLKFLLRALPEGAEVLDVGANIGLVCQVASRIVGASGRVHAIEPGELALGFLRQNLAGRDNCCLVTKALTDSEGPVTFFEGAGAAMVSSSLVADHAADRETSGLRAVTVMATTLDAYCARSGARPTLVKIDVEGAELSVLTGAARTLATLHPTILLEVSFRPEEHDRHYAPCLALLQAAGYVAHAIGADGNCQPIADGAVAAYGQSCTPEAGFLHNLANILFLHPAGPLRI